MPISQVNHHIIICDKCNKDMPPLEGDPNAVGVACGLWMIKVAGYRAIQREAEERGWRFHNRYVICPDCLKSDDIDQFLDAIYNK